MSSAHDPPEGPPAEPEPLPAWPPGPGEPAGPARPPAAGWPPAAGQQPRGRLRRHWLARGAGIVAVAVAVGLAALGALNRSGTAPGTTTAGSRLLTTAQIAATVDPGLADVNATLGYQGEVKAGTGMVLTSSGEVLTNNHVIEGATTVKVTDLGNGRTYPATVVGYDQAHDVAVLRLHGASGLRTVTIGNSSTVGIGQRVVALGNAGGQGGTPSVATGKVTGTGQSITASDESDGTTERLTGLIRTNAGIKAGDSGGPLVNTAGQVIGMNTAASSRFRFQSGKSTGTTAFAIPVNQARTIASRVVAGTASATTHIGQTGFLGVKIQPSPSGRGVEVVGTLPGGPARGAGLGAGDLITSLAGHTVLSPTSIRNVMNGYHPGDAIRIGWTDQVGQAHAATVRLARGPAG